MFIQFVKEALKEGKKWSIALKVFDKKSVVLHKNCKDHFSRTANSAYKVSLGNKDSKVHLVICP